MKPLKPCTHQSYWKQGGLAVLTDPAGPVFLAQVVFCSNCGISEVRTHKLIVGNPPEPVKPPVIAKP